LSDYIASRYLSRRIIAAVVFNRCLLYFPFQGGYCVAHVPPAFLDESRLLRKLSDERCVSFVSACNNFVHSLHDKGGNNWQFLENLLASHNHFIICSAAILHLETDSGASSAQGEGQRTAAPAATKQTFKVAAQHTVGPIIQQQPQQPQHADEAAAPPSASDTADLSAVSNLRLRQKFKEHRIVKDMNGRVKLARLLIGTRLPTSGKDTTFESISVDVSQPSELIKGTTPFAIKDLKPGTRISSQFDFNQFCNSSTPIVLLCAADQEGFDVITIYPNSMINGKVGIVLGLDQCKLVVNGDLNAALFKALRGPALEFSRKVRIEVPGQEVYFVLRVVNPVRTLSRHLLSYLNNEGTRTATTAGSTTPTVSSNLAFDEFGMCCAIGREEIPHHFGSFAQHPRLLPFIYINSTDIQENHTALVLPSTWTHRWLRARVILRHRDEQRKLASGGEFFRYKDLVHLAAVAKFTSSNISPSDFKDECDKSGKLKRSAEEQYQDCLRKEPAHLSVEEAGGIHFGTETADPLLTGTGTID
jgi:hypothetical protein